MSRARRKATLRRDEPPARLFALPDPPTSEADYRDRWGPELRAIEAERAEWERENDKPRGWLHRYDLDWQMAAYRAMAAELPAG